MADRDHPALALLRDAVYGGPPLPAGAAAALLRRLRLRPPITVIAVQHGDQAHPTPPRALARRLRALRLHPGLAYWCAPAADAGALAAHLAAQGIAHGRPCPCAHADRLLTAVRDAVMDLRRALGVPGTGPLPTAAEESRLRAEVAQRIAARDPRWPDSVQRWTAVALRRHHGSLSNLRRRMVEVLALATRERDDRAPAHDFRLAIERIYGCYAIDALARLFPELCIALVGRWVAGADDGGLARARSPVVRAAAACVRERFREAISLDDAATVAGVSSAHLARRFRRETGTSVGAVLLRLRIAEAKRLLGDPGLSVLQVALRSGFNSLERFHRAFRAACGTTPGAWRRESG